MAGELEIVTRKGISEFERTTRLMIIKKLAYHAEYLDIRIIIDLYETLMSNVEKGKFQWKETSRAVDKLEQTVLLRN